MSIDARRTGVVHEGRGDVVDTAALSASASVGIDPELLIRAIALAEKHHGRIRRSGFPTALEALIDAFSAAKT